MIKLITLSSPNSTRAFFSLQNSGPQKKLMRIVTLSICSLLVIFYHPAWSKSGSVYLEDLTWTEVRDDLRAGKTTMIIPIGGTEQSGPHISLGKHNMRAKVLAGKIATVLGNSLVAPVVAYVPEGDISPAKGHMRFPGTISITDQTFKSLLDGAARSMKQHGFVDIVLIGDHGGYQSQLKEVAARLNHEWAATKVRVHYIGDYYKAVDTDYVEALRKRGLSDEQIGLHAGAADTSLMMAIDPDFVRTVRSSPDAQERRKEGVNGDPRVSTAALGQIGVDLIVTHSVSAIRKAQNEKR